MSRPGSRLPWLIVGALGCLVLCLCLVVASGSVFFLTGMNSGSLLAQFSSATPTPATTPTVNSSTPQCSSSPALAPGILFNDDFSSQTVSECNGWSMSPGENVDYTWSPRKYTFSIKEPKYLGFDWPNGEYDNFAAEADAQSMSDGLTDYGLAFRINGAKNSRSYYMFAVTSDGNYYVQEKVAGNWVDDDPVSKNSSSAIKQGKTKNTVGVIARGSSFALYVNRILVKTVTNDSLPGKGAVGIFAGTDVTNGVVTFSRFTVMTPDRAQAEWR